VDDVGLVDDDGLTGGLGGHGGEQVPVGAVGDHGLGFGGHVV